MVEEGEKLKVVGQPEPKSASEQSEKSKKEVESVEEEKE